MIGKLIRMYLVVVLAVPCWGAGTIKVPEGTPVVLKLVNDISSRTHKKGDTVSLEVVQDVLVSGKKIIAAGTAVQGTVADAAGRFVAGIGGYLKLEVKTISSVNGSAIPVQLKQESSGKSSLWSVICGVVCCFIFLLIPGEDVSMKAGTLFNAQVLGVVEVPAS